MGANNGLGLDEEMREQAVKAVQDAVNNTYYEGIDDLQWMQDTLKRLG